MRSSGRSIFLIRMPETKPRIDWFSSRWPWRSRPSRHRLCGAGGPERSAPCCPRGVGPVPDWARRLGQTDLPSCVCGVSAVAPNRSRISGSCSLNASTP
jgi:hypothetical protein